MNKELDINKKYKTIAGYDVEKLERVPCFFLAIVRGHALKYTFNGVVCGWKVDFHGEDFDDYRIIP